MVGPARKRRSTPRSRLGCLPCRQHHRKCNEQRPICDVCQKNGRICDYGLRIVWGGRPFKKSAFGQCLSSSGYQSAPVVEIQMGSIDGQESSRQKAPFIYGFTQPKAMTPIEQPQTEPVSVASPNNPRMAEDQVYLLGMGNFQPDMHLTVIRPPSFLPNLPPQYRLLLEYFTHAVDSFSCDYTVKRDFCNIFLPMAFETSHVMASMLNLAAVHRANAGLAQCTKQLALLQFVAIEQLRAKLLRCEGRPTETVMATLIMLCYTSIVSGVEKASSWRVHLEGAASLFNQDSASWTVRSGNPTKGFIARCFVSLVALANMSGHPPSPAVSRKALDMVREESPSTCIDEFTAFSDDLLRDFIEIGTLLREREVPFDSSPLDLQLAPRDRCAEQELKLQRIAHMEHANLEEGLWPALPPARRDEYISINESYHQAAVLHIHQRLRRLPSSSNAVQKIVHRILTLVSGVELLDGPCPGIVLLFPLFSAGCGAVTVADRQQVRHLLKRMIDMYQIATVRHSLKVLETLWAHRDENGESEDNISWEVFIDSNVDLILY